MARKAIRDYRRATRNLTGTAELLMTYVETGAEFTRSMETWTNRSTTAWSRRWENLRAC